MTTFPTLAKPQIMMKRERGEGQLFNKYIAGEIFVVDFTFNGKRIRIPHEKI